MPGLVGRSPRLLHGKQGTGQGQAFLRVTVGPPWDREPARTLVGAHTEAAPSQRPWHQHRPEERAGDPGPLLSP